MTFLRVPKDLGTKEWIVHIGKLQNALVFLFPGEGDTKMLIYFLR